MSEDRQANSLDKIFGDLYPQNIESILDCGCGVTVKSQYLSAKWKVGIDIYKPYLEKVKDELPDILFINFNALWIDALFLPRSIDLIIMTDICEHLIKEDALMLIKKAEAIAKVAVIIETPLGFIPQNLDILGLGGHEYQTHRSGWSEKEFQDLGYKTILRDYKMQDVKRHTDYDHVPTDITLIDAIKLL